MICTGPNCTRDAGATSGLCESHRRQQSRGTPLVPLRTYNTAHACTGPGPDNTQCGDKVHANSLCGVHNNQMNRRGILTVIGISNAKRPPIVCRYGPCDRRATARGLCATHRNQERLGRPLTPIQPRLPEARPCAFTGCTRDARTKGMCGAHYNQSRRGVTLHTLSQPTPGPKGAPKPKPEPDPRGRNLPPGWFKPTLIRQPKSPTVGGNVTHDSIGAPIRITDADRHNAALVAALHGTTITERRDLLDMLGLTTTTKVA